METRIRSGKSGQGGKRTVLAPVPVPVPDLHSFVPLSQHVHCLITIIVSHGFQRWHNIVHMTLKKNCIAFYIGKLQRENFNKGKTRCFKVFTIRITDITHMLISYFLGGAIYFLAFGIE